MVRILVLITKCIPAKNSNIQAVCRRGSKDMNYVRIRLFLINHFTTSFTPKTNDMKNNKFNSTGKYMHYVLAVTFVLLVSTIRPAGIKAQTYPGLVSLDGYKTTAYFSPGNEERARVLALRCDNVMNYYSEFTGFIPLFTLLVLDPDDWSRFTNFPVYGMPHYSDNKTLIVASRDNEFWRSFIPPVDQLPDGLANNIRRTYSDEAGNLSMAPFFDLLVIHELGHAYHLQQGINMQRKWLAELFVNMFLHTYIAEKEQDLLPALTVFPKMVISGDKSSLTFTSLADLENRYDEIGQKYPQNYGWYQSRWHSAAADIYDAGGRRVITDLWIALENQKENLDDAGLARLLSGSAHQSVADVLLKWDEE